MPVERPIFPNEPTRKVINEPRPAAQLSTERNGQLYFWDEGSLLQFPPAWAKPNPQIALFPPKERPYLINRAERLLKDKYQQLIFPSRPILWPEEDKTDGRGWSYPGERPDPKPIHWPEEDPLIGEGYYYPHLNEIPPHYIRRNQEHWRRRQLRGPVSRTMELVVVGNFLHKMLMDVYPFTDSEPSPGETYPSSELGLPMEQVVEGQEKIKITKPILTWSMLFDRPKSAASEFNYFEREGNHIPKEDRKAWSIGMARITEYATNYFMSEAIKRKMDHPGLRNIADAYTVFCEYMTYGILIGGTVGRMKLVEQEAIQNGKDYKGALFQMIFRGNAEALSELVADTKEYSGLSDIDDMAMEIGYRRFKIIDLDKIIGKLEKKQSDGTIKAGVKNGATSLLAGGVYRNPGVTEISGGGIGLLTVEPVLINALYIATHPDIWSYFTNVKNDVDFIHALSLLIVNAIWAPILVYLYAGGHEFLHNHSANKKRLGAIPTELKRFEATPGFVNLFSEKELTE